MPCQIHPSSDTACMPMPQLCAAISHSLTHQTAKHVWGHWAVLHTHWTATCAHWRVLCTQQLYV